MGKRTRSDQRDAQPRLSHSLPHSPTADMGTSNKSQRGGSRLKYKDASSPKRKRTKSTLTLPEPLSLEGSLSEEVLLRCLSFLTANDLVTVSRVSSAWHRLSQDPQLWRSLYLRHYASASTRRQALAGITITRSRPWKELYKISTNWRNGAAKSTTVLTHSVRKAVLAPAPTDMTLSGENPLLTPPPPLRSTQSAEPDTILQIYRHYFFSTTRGQISTDPTDPPSIVVSHTLPNGTSQLLTTFSSSKLASFYSSRPDFRPPLSITEMRLDESVTRLPSTSTLHLAVFYSTGQFSIFRLDLPTTISTFSVREVYTSFSLSSTSLFNHPATSSSSSASPFDAVSLAKFHYPLLVTCSNSFTLRFYQLSKSTTIEPNEYETIHLSETETPLQSRERWAPVVLSLEKIRLGKSSFGKVEEFKVSLAYSLPVFPNDWTVGLQEFTITLSREKLPSITTLQAISIPTNQTSLTSLHSQRRYSTPFNSSTSLAVSSSPVTSIEYSSPFIVTSRTDNIIEVYRVIDYHTRPSTTKKERCHHGRLEIRFEKTLFGHTARVGSVALLATGEVTDTSSSLQTEGEETRTKLVSAGDDGSFKVWKLSSSPRRTSTSRKRNRIEYEEGGEEGVIDIKATTSFTRGEEEDSQEEEQNEWQKLKKRRNDKDGKRSVYDNDGPVVASAGERTSGTVQGGGKPERIQKILVDQDKIVVVGSASSPLEGTTGGGRESIRVLRFD